MANHRGDLNDAALADRCLQRLFGGCDILENTAICSQHLTKQCLGMCFFFQEGSCLFESTLERMLDDAGGVIEMYPRQL